ncbi:circadian clock protein KaiB [Leptolyngbya sp. NK1-12]|uniref:Circadian clock protein KaiB n=1 Tax=Leptolyngbya sp. NK1-12 TaxID=2547451 RepID=A0AA96WTF9_9CYAN|nr:circadian clock KaiB family protein [Leptolyngbya sp. NK1-12]WNZ22647.1 circadian clock protein KaiB [Leptolyngbya sp. NK1-12]
MGNVTDSAFTPLKESIPLRSALFKGIAVFTPAGDLVYCIDPQKQNRWHLQLCIFLQELLGLPEPPHFLVPCFTATIDRWQDPRTGVVRTFAEVYPFVSRQRALLSAVFGCSEGDWQIATPQATLCDPLVLASYRQQFPELWQNHDLVAQLEAIEPASPLQPVKRPTPIWFADQSHTMQGYVLRLFVSGGSTATEQMLKMLHQLLEEQLQQPYTLKVIDVRKHPEQAEADQVTATPTLLKVWPQPVRRVVGEVDDPTILMQLIR